MQLRRQLVIKQTEQRKCVKTNIVFQYLSILFKVNTGETECGKSWNRNSKQVTIKFKNSETTIKRDILKIKIEFVT